MSQARQKIRFVEASDGVKLAWAESGSGATLIKAANWLTHLEYEWESPVWRHWNRFFTDHFRFILYAERGCGLSDWEVGKLTTERWIDDRETIVDAAQPSGPFALLGISQGAAACIGYAVRHPERVSHMILYGGYARGLYHRGKPDIEREYKAILEVVRIGWGKSNPAFRQLFTSRFIPDGTQEQIAWFNDLCLKTTSPEVAAELLRMRADMSVRGLLPRVRVPTLVIHAGDDHITHLSEGRLLASSIPGAQFVEVPGKNHVLLEDEPGWERFKEAVLDFTGAGATAPDTFAALSPREREVLALISEGLDNAQIGARLAISEKTVRNHISNVYDKLGVWNRSEERRVGKECRSRWS